MRTPLRSLVASRAFAMAAIGTIALAISLAATVFAVVDGVLFTPHLENLGTTAAGIAVIADDGALTIRHPDRRDVVLSNAAEGISRYGLTPHKRMR